MCRKLAKRAPDLNLLLLAGDGARESCRINNLVRNFVMA